jgi:hypothetical protein
LRIADRVATFVLLGILRNRRFARIRRAWRGFGLLTTLRICGRVAAFVLLCVLRSGRLARVRGAWSGFGLLTTLRIADRAAAFVLLGILRNWGLRTLGGRALITLVLICLLATLRTLGALVFVGLLAAVFTGSRALIALILIYLLAALRTLCATLTVLSLRGPALTTLWAPRLLFLVVLGALLAALSARRQERRFILDLDDTRHKAGPYRTGLDHGARHGARGLHHQRQRHERRCDAGEQSEFHRHGHFLF